MKIATLGLMSNESDWLWCEQAWVRFASGLSAIREWGNKVQLIVLYVNTREYKDIYRTLLEACEASVMWNRKAFGLAYSGGFDSFGLQRTILLVTAKE